MDRVQGVVLWFGSKGQSYGYITRDDGVEIFVHYKSLLEDGQTEKSFRKLEKGQRVEFEISPGYFCEGTQATKVKIV